MSGFILGFAIGIVINDILFACSVLPRSTARTSSSSGRRSRRSRRRAAQRWSSVQRRSGCLLLMRYGFPKPPRALIVATLSIVAVELLDLADHGVAITGDVPTGLFLLDIPGIDWSDTGALAVGALAVVFVGYSEYARRSAEASRAGTAMTSTRTRSSSRRGWRTAPQASWADSSSTAASRRPRSPTLRAR